MLVNFKNLPTSCIKNNLKKNVFIKYTLKLLKHIENITCTAIVLLLSDTDVNRPSKSLGPLVRILKILWLISFLVCYISVLTSDESI